MRPRVILALCSVAALAISAWAVLAPSGLSRLRALEQEAVDLEARATQARRDNARRADDVRVLQGGTPDSDRALEKAVREELGWVKKDEVVLLVPTDAPGPTP